MDTPEKNDLPAYTVEQIEEMSIRMASKFHKSVLQYTDNWGRVQEHLQDLAGAFVMGALTATAKLEPGRTGARSYQWKSGRGEILHALRELRREYQREEVSLSVELENDGEGEEVDCLADVIANEKSENPYQVFSEKIDNAAAVDALQGLSERDRYILNARHVEGRQVKEIAVELGLSEGRISQIESAARETLRKQLVA